jgi:hemerythrin-like domain-containing protein
VSNNITEGVAEMDFTATNPVAEEETEIGDGGASPYAPPEAYNPPKIDEQIPYENMHPLLQKFIDEHNDYDRITTNFEETLEMIKSGKVDKEVNDRLLEFYTYFDEKVREHNIEEEKTIFPVISKIMNETGDHSKSGDYFNSIDVLEDEHSKMFQLSAITFNLFALFSRIPDEKSRIIILDAALEQAKELVELLKVHAYREDTIIFNYAQTKLSDEEMTEMLNSLNKEKNYGN